MYEIAVVLGAGFVFSVVCLLALLNDVLIFVLGSYTRDFVSPLCCSENLLQFWMVCGDKIWLMFEICFNSIKSYSSKIICVDIYPKCVILNANIHLHLFFKL